MASPERPRPLERAAIALGSNLGNRRATLDAAVVMLIASPGIQLLARSTWHASAPLGPPQPDYLNGCAVLTTSLAPEALLEQLLAIERHFGRVRGERWGPRTLDLDLIFYGQLRLQSPRLEIPHPHLRERAFVLGPLTEIAPRWLDPVSGCTVAELAAQSRVT
jgi:2-amino-4-hydroxy-6-hydroxymethyldihydropteridine diphosphokinase